MHGIYVDHAGILGSYGKLWFIVKTKPSVFSQEWSEGVNIDLMHNCWIIRTDDPSKLHNADVNVHFEHVVDEGGVRASDERHSGDLLTAKLLVLESLRGRHFRAVSAALAETRLNAFFWIVRWRAELHIKAMRHLSYPLFDQHCKLLEGGGIQGLIPINERIARYEADVHNGVRQWPTYAIHRRTILSVEQLATDLGIPLRTLTRPIVRSQLTDSLKRTSSYLINNRNRRASNGGIGDNASFEAFVYESALRYLSVWQAIRKMSEIGLLSHDPILFDPFEKSDISKRAKQISRASQGRTKIIEAEVWLKLLNGAALWVLDFAKPLLSVVERAKELHVEIFGGSSRGSGPGKLAKFRNCLQSSIEDFKSKVQNHPNITAAWRRGNNWSADDKRIPLDEAITFLVIACFIIITGFSARRKNETLSVQEGCCWRDPFGNHWLSTYIEKSLREIDKIPVPGSVAVAVTLMEELSATTRSRTGEPWLFRVQRPSNVHGVGGRPNLELDIGDGINRFAALIGIKPIEGGEDWSFAAHQLRKAFGVYYYHGQRYPKFDALSRFLRHYDPEMTRRYVADVLSGSLLRMSERLKARRLAHDEAQDRKRMDRASTARDAINDAVHDVMDRANAFEEVRQEAYVERTMEVVDGVEAPIGRGAARLYDELEQMIADARGSIVVKGRSNAPPDDVRVALIDRVRAVAKHRYREPVPGAHAHCGCQPGSAIDLASARCLEEKRRRFGELSDIRPDYAFASKEACLGCVHCIMFSENTVVMDKRAVRLEAASKIGVSVEARAAADRKLDSLLAGLKGARAAVQGRGRLDV